MTTSVHPGLSAISPDGFAAFSQKRRSLAQDALRSVNPASADLPADLPADYPARSDLRESSPWQRLQSVGRWAAGTRPVGPGRRIGSHLVRREAMMLKVFVAAVTSLSLGLPLVPNAAPQGRGGASPFQVEPLVEIDGAKTPALIPDYVLWREGFRTLREAANGKIDAILRSRHGRGPDRTVGFDEGSIKAN